MRVTLEQACRLLADADNITIIAHQKPDGDTLGASFGLLRGLEQLGKTARVLCSDGYPARYAPIITGSYRPPRFNEEFVVAVDIADLQLFGDLREAYGHRVNLCIDHHPSNSGYAKYLYLQPDSASTSEMVFRMLEVLDVAITPEIATAIYTGISTDTGCFRYGNTTASSHDAAARLIGLGARHEQVNRLMFETHSRERFKVEAQAKASIEYYFGGNCAIMYITPQMLAGTQVSEYDLEGFSAFPRQIEGVEAGVTVRVRENGECRVSMRTCEKVDASIICQQLGGGGHMRAAGCTLTGGAEAAREQVLQALAPCFPNLER